MNATWTLIRNDLRWAGPLAGLGLLGHLIALASDGVASLWILPTPDWGLMNLAYYAVSGTLLGLVASTVDEVTGTHEYLLHRPQSHARIFWTRHLLMLAILVLWMVSTPSLHLMGSHLLSLDAPLIDDGRWAMRVCEGVPGLLFYALAVFCVSVTRTLWGGALLTVTVGLMSLGLVLATLLVDFANVSGCLTLLACLLLTAPLLAGALRSQREGRDRDRPWHEGRLWLAGPLLVLITAAVGAGVMTLVHAFGAGALHNLYPSVALHEGQYILRRWSNDDRVYRRVDSQHRWAESVPDAEPSVSGIPHKPWALLETKVLSPQTFPPDGVWFRGHRYLVTFGGPRRRPFFGSDGYLHVYQLATRNRDGENRPSVTRVGKAPNGTPFSPETIMLSQAFNQAVLLDPSDGGIWVRSMLDDAPSFVRKDLPGGDHFVRAETYDAPPVQFWTGDQPPPPRFVVVGARGKYVLVDGSWQVAKPLERPELHPKPAVTVRQYRAGRFDLSLQSIDGAASFQHSFRPYTWAEHTAELFVEGPTLLRPLPLVIASLWSSPALAYRPGGWLLLDAPVAIGSRMTVFGCALLTVLLAGFTWARLGRLGVDGRRRRFWTVAVLLGGVAGFLCARLVETARAWKTSVAPPASESRAAMPVRPLLAAD